MRLIRYQEDRFPGRVWPSPRFPRPLGWFALAALTLLSSTACASTGAGRIEGFEGVQVGPNSACTSSQAFEQMPGMSLDFQLDRSGPVVLLFEGQFGGFDSTAGARATIRFTIDGAIVGSAVAVANDHGTGLQTFGFNAFSEPLPGGMPHTAKVLWHTFPAGATSCVEERSLIVLRP